MLLGFITYITLARKLSEVYFHYAVVDADSQQTAEMERMLII